MRKSKKKQGSVNHPLSADSLKKYMLAIPLCFSVDLLHLVCINTGELVIPLWRGQLKCDLNDNKETWDWVKLVGETSVEHGKLVANATQ